MKLQGRVWKYGDDVNTDVIFPGKYTYTVTEPREQAQHALEDLDPDFASQVQQGDIIAAGKNWGAQYIPRIGHEVIVPVTEGRLDLGPWQQIYYAEFDGQRRKRVIVKIIGE